MLACGQKIPTSHLGLLMIKSEFITTLAAKCDKMSENEIADCVNLLLKYISDNLAQGGRVEARDFGSFDITHRPSRVAHNPKTLVKLTIDEKCRVHFKPGKELRERVNQSRLQKSIVEDSRDEE